MQRCSCLQEGDIKVHTLSSEQFIRRIKLTKVTRQGDTGSTFARCVQDQGPSSGRVQLISIGTYLIQSN